MYKRILVTLENSSSDARILGHVRELASALKSEVILMHVADGWAARNVTALQLRESQEMRDDMVYLEKCCAELEAAGVEADALLASGDPSTEIVAAAEREQVDLIAMATHGHRFLNDLVRGSVANEVRHQCKVPVLLVRA
jgi:nucleotide-binding universal stress UspA family protein